MDSYPIVFFFIASLLACLWLAIMWAIERNKSAALEQKVEALKKELTSDPLTGLQNRKGFDKLAERYFQREARPEGRLAAAYFDLDHFKEVNDKIGHQAGDQVLRLFAKMLQELFRPGDAIARLGGDEYVVVAPRISKEVLEARCKSARILLERATKEEFGIACSATIGMASIAGENLMGTSLAHLMNEVEREMRKNKQERG